MPLNFDPATGDVVADSGMVLDFPDLDSLAKEIEAMGKKGKEVAEATFESSGESAPSNKRGAEATVNVKLIIRMPEWKQRDSRPKAEQGEWDRFLRALRAHEDGHIALYRREFSRSFKRLKKVAASKFQDEFNDEVARVKAVNRKYDKMTGNGTKQETPHGTTIIQVP